MSRREKLAFVRDTVKSLFYSDVLLYTVAINIMAGDSFDDIRYGLSLTRRKAIECKEQIRQVFIDNGYRPMIES